MTAEVASPQSVVTWRDQKMDPSGQSLQSAVTRVESQLKYYAQKKMVRVSEFFRDFDSLRSGFITNQQFRSCLNENLGLYVSDEDFECLVQKYGQEKKGMINYKAFENVMENAFNPRILDGKPSGQIQNFQRSARLPSHNLTEDHLRFTDNVLLCCHEYYKCRGITVRSCYSDFDRHHRGFVTEGQFHRSFPGPPGISSAEISALAQRYYDPSNGLHNYIRFHDDVIDIGARDAGGYGGPRFTVKDQGPPTPTVQALLERIKDGIYKKGVRTTEFFRDFDKLRSGIITEKQFASGLCCDKVAYLNTLEAQIVVDHYKNPDGRVRYTDFCHLMENAYNEPELEKKPTTDVYRPLRGHLLRPLNPLDSPETESKVVEILQRLKTEVKQRGLLLYPFFSDFDKGKGYTRGVTKPQFERILHFLSLNLSTEEVRLLESKFESGNGLDVNYTAFTQSIDEQYIGQVVEGESKPPESYPTNPLPRPLSTEEVELLVSRLREFVLCNGIRAQEYFQDSDLLRANSITASRFRQGLNSMMKSDLSDSEFLALCALYPDPKKDGHVRWKEFVSVMEPVLRTAVDVPTQAPLPTLRTGAIDFNNECTTDDQKCLEVVLYRMSERLRLRRILAKPVFQDYDWHHIGYVTCNQFRQCLTFLGLEASEEELRVMDARFSDAKGFNYLQFVEEVQPSEKLDYMYKTRINQILSKKKLVTTSGSDSTDALVKILEKIKIKVSKERMRVQEFMKDYDKLRSGRVLKINFARGLDLCGFELSPEDVNMLQNRYSYPKDPDFVNYMAFSDEVESVFTTKGLEKTPNTDVEVFVAPVEVGIQSPLTSEENEILDRTMHRLAERVRARRIQLYPLFEDFDKAHNGNVTKTQFRRVLSELEIVAPITALEFDIMFRKFEVKIGGRIDMNYIAFSEMCYDYAQTVWTDTGKMD